MSGPKEKRFELMEKLAQEGLSSEKLCETLQVSRSGFYSWKLRPESLRAQSNAALTERIKAIHSESQRTYGLPRIQVVLQSEGNSCGKHRLSRPMKTAGVCGLIKKRYRPYTTDSNHGWPVAERIFKTECPETHPTGYNQQ